MTDTHRPADDDSRALSRSLLAQTTHAALGTLWQGAPMVTRVGCLWLPGAGLGLLLSDLSDHAAALAADARCSALVSGPMGKGDPLTHPRLTLIGRAEPVNKTLLREGWLAARPKARLYYDFADFNLRVIRIDRAMLNAGFGRAHRMDAADLDAAP